MKLQFFKYAFTLILAITLMSNNLLNNSTIKIEAKYIGFDDFGYSFSYISSEGEIETLTFEEIKEKYINEFYLEDKNTIGKKFEVTYTLIESENDDNYTMELILDSLKLIE